MTWPRAAVRSTMQCCLFLVLGSLRLAATSGPVEKRAVPTPQATPHVIQVELDERNLSMWEWCGVYPGRTDHQRAHFALRNQEWRSSEECAIFDDGKEEVGPMLHTEDTPSLWVRISKQGRACLLPSPPPPPSTPQLSPFLLLLALLTIVAFAGGATYDLMDLTVFDEPAEETDDRAGDQPPNQAEDDTEDTDGEPWLEPVSPKVDMTFCAHDPNRRVDLDAIAGQTTANALLQHERSATGPVSHGRGRAISLPHKVYLARLWERGAQRLWHRLQPHMDSDTWILCTSETYTLFVRRSVCPALMHQLPDLGEFVGPALGKQAGRVVFDKRARGAITLTTLLAALQKAASEAMDEQLEEVVFVSFADRLPLANYPLNEDGVSPEAPLGLTGARLLDFFGQHLDRSTCLFFADVAVHESLRFDENGDVVWSLLAKRSREERRGRKAVVDLGASEMDQYNQHGMSAGWMKLRLRPSRRRELAEDAIDAHTVETRSLLRDSRLSGSGIYWDAPVHL